MAITAVQDWDNDGFLVIKGEGTLKRYSELKEQMGVKVRHASLLKAKDRVLRIWQMVLYWKELNGR